MLCIQVLLSVEKNQEKDTLDFLTTVITCFSPPLTLQGCLIHTIDGLPDNRVFFHREPLSKAGEPATILGSIPFLQTQREKKTSGTSLGPRPYSHSFLISGGVNILKDPFHT